jgi:hypothetical protein
MFLLLTRITPGALQLDLSSEDVEPFSIQLGLK